MARKKIIPKRIGNLKIPKPLRKLGDQVLADPRAREVAASALLSLGAALAARGTRKGTILRDIFDHPGESAKAARDTGADAASKAGETMSGVAQAVNQAVGDVIDTVRRDFVRKMRGARSADGTEPEAQDKRDNDEDRVH